MVCCASIMLTYRVKYKLGNERNWLCLELEHSIIGTLKSMCVSLYRDYNYLSSVLSLCSSKVVTGFHSFKSHLFMSFWATRCRKWCGLSSLKLRRFWRAPRSWWQIGWPIPGWLLSSPHHWKPHFSDVKIYLESCMALQLNNESWDVSCNRRPQVF